MIQELTSPGPSLSIWSDAFATAEWSWCMSPVQCVYTRSIRLCLYQLHDLDIQLFRELDMQGVEAAADELDPERFISL